MSTDDLIHELLSLTIELNGRDGFSTQFEYMGHIKGIAVIVAGMESYETITVSDYIYLDQDTAKEYLKDTISQVKEMITGERTFFRSRHVFLSGEGEKHERYSRSPIS